MWKVSRAEDTIEFVLAHLSQVKIAVAEAKPNVSGKSHTGGNGSGHSRISDPTAITALRAIMDMPYVDIPYGPIICGHRECWRLSRPEKWITVGDIIADYYLNNSKMADFYTSRYIKGDLWQTTCRKLNIRRGAYYAMRADVLHHAELYAVHYGIMAPCDYGIKML